MKHFLYLLLVVLVVLITVKSNSFFNLFSSQGDKYSEKFVSFFDKTLSSYSRVNEKLSKQAKNTYLESYQLFLDNYLYEPTDIKKTDLEQDLETNLVKVIDLYKKDNKDLNPVNVMNDVLSIVFSSIDAHTLWLSPDGAKAFQKKLGGEYSGIGVLFRLESVESKELIILRIFNNSPAFKSGLMVGDKIIGVDNKTSKDFKSIEDFISSIKGKSGTHVKVTVLRNGVSKDMDVVRGDYYVPSVNYKIIAKNYEYIQIDSFNSDTATLFKSALESGHINSLKGLIIDLRNNPGGLLNAVSLIGDNLLSDSTIVSIKGRAVSNNMTFRALSETVINESIPIVVLINSYSASAAELLSGALALNNRAILMGDNTFGKWSVQTSFPLKSGGQFNVTTQLFYAPQNVTFQGEGIAPDIMILPTKPMQTIREKDYPNHLRIDHVNAINRQPKLKVKEELCPISNDSDFRDDRTLGCAKLFLDNSADIDTFSHNFAK